MPPGVTAGAWVVVAAMVKHLTLSWTNQGLPLVTEGGQDAPLDEQTAWHGGSPGGLRTELRKRLFWHWPVILSRLSLRADGCIDEEASGCGICDHAWHKQRLGEAQA